MFISRKKYKELLKRIADLEGQVQSQQSKFELVVSEANPNYLI